MKNEYSSQYVASITLNELFDRIKNHLNENPEDMNKMVYFDGLHICGKFNNISDTLIELY